MTDGPHINGVPLREYVEALLREKQEQLEVASAEREKAAQALRDQQYRAMEQAEREREKAAEALRMGLDRSIKEGDERLREHISNQIQQINAALSSAEKLEVQRLVSARDWVDGLRREMQLITEAAQEAVGKAEEAQKEVNSKSNEFRGQLADQAANLMPRKESESKFNETDRRIEEARHEREARISSLDKRVQALERGESGQSQVRVADERRSDRTQPWQLAMFSVLGSIVSGGLIAVLVVALSN